VSSITWVEPSKKYHPYSTWTGVIRRHKKPGYKYGKKEYQRKFRRDYREIMLIARVRKAFQFGSITITACARRYHIRPLYRKTKGGLDPDEIVMIITTSGSPTFPPMLLEEINMVAAEALDEVIRRHEVKDLEDIWWSR